MTLDEAIAKYENFADSETETARVLRNVGNEKDAKYFEETAENDKKIVAWLTELQERREADRWIPVSERPPKVSGYYLVTRTVNSGKGFVRRSFYDVSLKEWDESRVTAWRSLPEAYKESEGE